MFLKNLFLKPTRGGVTSISSETLLLSSLRLRPRGLTPEPKTPKTPKTPTAESSAEETPAPPAEAKAEETEVAESEAQEFLELLGGFLLG